MALSVRGESAVLGTGTSAIGTEPAGTAQGDLLVALYLVSNTGGSAGIPAGWTSLFSGPSFTPSFRYNLAVVVRGASAPSLAFTHTGSAYRELYILAILSDNGSTIAVDDAQAIAPGNGAGNTGLLNPPAATATTAADLAIAAAAYWPGSGIGGYTAPGSYIVQTNNANGNDGVMATRVLAASGTEDPGSFNANRSTVGDYWAATVLLKESTGGGPAPAFVPAQVSGPSYAAQRAATI